MKSVSAGMFASGVFAWLTVCAPGLAIDITFSATSGYSVTGGTVFGNGNLVGQPGGGGVTTWQGSTTAGTDEIRVVADGSGQCAQTVNLPVGTSPIYKFAPSAADLGGTFDPAASVVAYSFKVRFDDAPNATASTVLRPRFGEDGSGNPVMAFEVWSNGKFNYTDGATAILAKTTSGGSVDYVASTGVYYTASGLINYATNAYTLYINGVAQKGATGNVWLGFKSTAGKTPNFTLRELGNATANYRRLSVGEIHIALGSRLLPEQALRADDLVNDIGICTHLGNSTGTSPYASVSAESLIGQLGIRHIRENMAPNAAYSRLDNLYNTYGMRTLLIGRTSNAPSIYLPILKAHPAIEGMEGLNEPDHPLASYSYGGFTDDKLNNNYAATIAYQNDLYAAVKGDPLTANVMIVAPSMAEAVKSRFLANVPADYLGFHPYSGGSMPSASPLDSTLIPGSQKMGPQPLIATETGYHTATGFVGYPYYVSEVAEAKYTGRTIAEFADRGLPAYFYEFFDQGTDLTDKELNFGLVRNNLTVKPSYTVIKNLSALLTEATWNPSAKNWVKPGYTAGALDYTVVGGDVNLHHLLLKKGTGEFYLLLWREISSYNIATHADIVNSTMPVTVTLNTSIGQASVYLLDSLTPTATYVNPSVLTLNVPDEVMVVKLTPLAMPRPWDQSDVGTPSLAGSASGNAGSFTVSASGADIWGSADAFRYVYQAMPADGQIVAKLTGVPTTDGWSKAGVMIRETLSAGSKYAGVFLTRDNGAVLQSRTTTNGSSTNAALARTVPQWVRLVRSAGVFTASVSPDGATWTQVGSPVAVSMTGVAYVGLAVTAHTNTALGTATYEQVSVDGGLPVVEAIASEAHASLHPSRQGVWTISRTGSLSAPLTVNYSLGGSAINGTDYVSIPTSVTIPAGAASVPVTLIPVEVANKQGQFNAVLTLASSAAYHVGSAKSDVVGYSMSSLWVTDFETGGASAWTWQERSSVAVNGTLVDSGSNALQWTYSDDGITPWHNEIQLTFSAARDWSKVEKVTIRFAEDAGNPPSDLGARMGFELLNNNTKVSGGTGVATFKLTKETGYRTIELNLGTYARDQITGIIFYTAGSDLATGTHVWRIDNIKVK